MMEFFAAVAIWLAVLAGLAWLAEVLPDRIQRWADRVFGLKQK